MRVRYPVLEGIIAACEMAVQREQNERNHDNPHL